MNKKIITILACAATVFSLAACGTGKKTTTSAATETPVTQTPATEAPKTEAPTEAPKTEAPTETPTEAPTEAIVQQDPTITIGDLDRTYDGSSSTADFTTDSDGAVTISWYQGETRLTAAPYEVGTYKLVITTTETKYFNAGKAEKEFTISAEKIAVPTPETTTFTYDGTVHSLNFGRSVYYSTRDNEGIDVGEYEVRLHLNNSVEYTWDDGTTEDKTFTMTIVPCEITLKEGFYHYYSKTTNARFVLTTANSNVAEIDSGKLMLDLTLENGEVGTQKVVAQKLLNYEDNTEYTGGNYTINFIDTTQEVRAYPVLAPIASAETTYEYDGEEHTIQFYENDSQFTEYNQYFNITGNDAQVNAGTYTATLSLKDKDNYVWSDGTTEDKTYTMVIKPREVKLTASSTVYTGNDCELVSLIASNSNVLPADKGKLAVRIYYEDTNVGTKTVQSASLYNYYRDGTIQIDMPYTGGNYTVSNLVGTTRTITAKQISIPAPTTAITYDGAAHSLDFTSDTNYSFYKSWVTISGNDAQTKPGSYTVTVALKDKTNTCWADLTTDDKTYTMTITPDYTAYTYGTPVMTVVPTATSYGYVVYTAKEDANVKTTVKLPKLNSSDYSINTAGGLTHIYLNDHGADNAFSWAIYEKTLPQSYYDDDGDVYWDELETVVDWEVE